MPTWPSKNTAVFVCILCLHTLSDIFVVFALVYCPLTGLEKDATRNALTFLPMAGIVPMKAASFGT